MLSLKFQRADFLRKTTDYEIKLLRPVFGCFVVYWPLEPKFSFKRLIVARPHEKMFLLLSWWTASLDNWVLQRNLTKEIIHLGLFFNWFTKYPSRLGIRFLVIFVKKTNVLNICSKKTGFLCKEIAILLFRNFQHDSLCQDSLLKGRTFYFHLE